MLTYYFDKDSKIPLYVQLYSFIRQEIEKGILQYNEKMPSKRKLSTHLKISEITVDTAYQQLVCEGYLRVVPKSGFFVEQFVKTSIVADTNEFVNLTKNKIKEKYDYDFKTNVVDVNLFPKTTWVKLARAVLSENNYDMVNATNPQGLHQLRLEISKYLYNYRGINANADQIIVGAGLETLMAIIIKLLGRSKTYAVENPGYSKMFYIFKNNDVHTVPISLDEQGLKVNELRNTNASIVHITPSHQFPSGVIMPIRRRIELLNWASEEINRYIIEDDYDSEFRFSGQPIPAMQGLDSNHKVIYINSFSKSIAPSLRISYIVLPKNLLHKFNELHYSCSVPTFEQYILCRFMQGGYFERHINRMRKAYKERIESFVSAIENSKLKEIVKIYAHDTGLHFLIQVNNKSEEELVSKAKQVGIRLYGLSEYYQYQTDIIPQSTIVIGYSNLTPDEIKTAIKRLETVWV